MVYEPGKEIFVDGDEIEVDITTGKISNITKGTEVKGNPFSDVQLDIYRRGGLLVKPCGE